MNKISCRIFKRKKHVLNLVFASIIASTMAVSVAHAAPTGGQVVAGDATINQTGGTTDIKQSTQNSIINWNGFSIGINEVVNFFNGSGATLNRVVGQSVSEIFGALNATGSVYVINENGVMVGDSGVVTTGGSFIASTHNVSDIDFMNGGDLTFNAPKTGAAVINLGKVNSGDQVMLIGGDAFNEGIIRAGGDVTMLAGSNDVVMFVNSPYGAKYQVVSANNTVTNNANSANNNPLSFAMNGGGQNNNVSIVNGRIVNTGSITSRGTATLIGSNETILKSGSSLRARNVNVGGQFQGGAALPPSMRFASQRTTVENGAKIRAARNAVVWADDSTLFAGHVKAGTKTKKGFVEISGKNNLNLPNGITNSVSFGAAGGSLLLDPTDIQIIAGDGPDINHETVSDNTLYNQDVQNFLNNSGDLTIQTSDSGAGNGDIDVNADIVWSADNALTMKAHNDININGVNIDASAATGKASYYAYAGNDINVNAGSSIKSGQQGTVELNAATTNPFASSSAAGRIGNWKDGTGTVNFNGASEIQTKNLAIRSGKDSSGARSDFGTNVTLKNHTGEFGNVQLHGFENVDFNVNGTNDDYESNLSLLVNAKNINIDEDKMKVSGAFMLNAAAFDDNTNNFVDYSGDYNSLGSINGSGWKNNHGTVTFSNPTGTNLDLCCGVTIQSGLDASGNRVDVTKQNVNFTYNRDYAVYNWFQVHGFNDFETTFEGGKLTSNTYVDIHNVNNEIDFDIETGKDIVSPTYNVAGSNGDVLIVSDKDTNIAANVDIVATEDVTVVVDEQTPFAPSTGALTMDSTATITSGGDTAFFTSMQGQNNIAGTINGDTFTPGVEYLPTSIEEWLVFYQNKNRAGQSPYKVYYKDNGNPPLPNGLDCDEESGDPACQNFVNLIDNRREYRVALSGEGNDIGENALARGSSEDFRNNEFYTALDADYVDNHLNTDERFGLLYSVPLDLVQTSLLDLTLPGIQGIAELIISPVTSQF